MERQEVFEAIREVICFLLSRDPSEVTEESSLYEDLGADSLDALEIAMEVETALGITIPDYVFEKIRTVGEMVDYVKDGKIPER